jgi:hypothetical protein
MKAALPDLSENVLLWRLHFAIGAMAHAMRLCGSRWPAAAFFPPSNDTETVVRLLVTFLANGMVAPDAREDGHPAA